MSSEMPWGLWTFTGQGLVPYSEYDFKLVADRYAPGTDLRSKFAQPRSLPHHRLYFAVLMEVVEATGLWLTAEDLHEALKLHMRMVREVRMLHGEIRFVTRSIEFTKMDQGEFRRFFDHAMLTLQEQMGIDTEAMIALAKAKIEKTGQAPALQEIA